MADVDAASDDDDIPVLYKLSVAATQKVESRLTKSTANKCPASRRHRLPGPSRTGVASHISQLCLGLARWLHAAPPGSPHTRPGSPTGPRRVAPAHLMRVVSVARVNLRISAETQSLNDSNCKGRAMYRIGAVRALLASERQSWTQSRAREEGGGVARSQCELPTVRGLESRVAATLYKLILDETAALLETDTEPDQEIAEDWDEGVIEELCFIELLGPTVELLLGGT
ncbi:hypothetical protein DFH09DRAFT_1434666 [Mycena vulgaris]|nr:hypothetical protein DFH09DRAFT_1434666 [Mycena vulgaris]